MKSKILLFGLFLTLITIGCSKNDEAEDNETISADEAGINAKIDVENDDVYNIVDNQYENFDSNVLSYKDSNAQVSYLSTCATITRVPAFGTAPTVGQTVTKTIDFGTGCQINNGNFLSGKIIMSFVYDPSATTHTVNCTFENFKHNTRRIEGTKTFTRTMTAATASSPSHPIWVMNMNLTITLSDGRILTRVGTRTSEIIAGYNTPASWTDNVYSVTGNWTTTFPNTVAQTSTITSPIIVKLACVPTNSSLSKGVITFVRNSHTATLDYGNGDCDNLAIFTINGVSFTINIGQ
jgi:hypothetical protein